MAANALVTLTYTQYRSGDLDGALTTGKTAESRLGLGESDADKTVRARAQQIIAQVLAGKAEDKAALAAFDQSLALYRSVSTTKPELIAKVLNNRGVLLSDMSRYDRRTRLFGRGQPDLPIDLSQWPYDHRPE